MGLDLRSGSQEKSCGEGLRGFESHPPHHDNGQNIGVTIVENGQLRLRVVFRGSVTEMEHVSHSQDIRWR
jgi:hypothetical protein